MTDPAVLAGPVAAIRYMGNKRALLPAILDTVGAVASPGSLVVDPMAGSHAVSQALKHGHRLVTSDAQEYSAVLGRAFVDNVSLPRAPADRVADLLRAAGVAAARGGAWFERTLADTYLGREQCRQLDGLRAAVDLVAPDGGDPFRWLALAATMAAACRGQASPGHFAQFLPNDHVRTRAVRRVDLLGVARECLERWHVEPGLPGSRSLALAWRDLVGRAGPELRDAEAWYLDPPYTRDQYSRFYHVLETVARGDEPDVAHGARYRVDRFRSAFCSTVTAARELADLLAAVRSASPGASVVLSYSSRGLLGRDDLVAAAGPAFRVADFRELGHEYSTQGKGVVPVTEWLTVLVPPRVPRRGSRGPREGR